MAVIKLLSRHTPSYKSLIRYILKAGHSQVFTHNLRGATPEEWVREFLRCEVYRAHPRSRRVFLTHEIISFGPQDAKHLTSEMLEDIARKYIELRGSTGLFVASVHRDREHVHIHFCTSGIQLYTGKAMRLSRSQLTELKRSLQAYHLEKYPQVSHSRCQHGSGKRYTRDKEWYRQKRITMTADITKIVSSCFTKARSQQDFLERLQKHDLHYYERSGKPAGIITSNNTKFRFTGLSIPFSSLPNDTRTVKKTLQAIRAIRAQQDHDIER